MRRLLILFAVLAACVLLTGASCGRTRPEPPEREVVVQKEIVTVEVPVYRSLPPELVRDCDSVPEGPNSQVFELLARARRALADCGARMREVRGRQGSQSER